MENVLKEANNLLDNLYHYYFEEEAEKSEGKLALATEKMCEDITAKRQKNKSYRPLWTITEVSSTIDLCFMRF